VTGLPADLANQVEAALREDLGSGDVTASLVPAAQRVRGSIITREAAVLCGRAWVEETFRQLDPKVQLTWQAADGDRIAPEQIILRIAGPARPVLSGERTALNFLQLLSGTATVTRRFVDAVAGTECRILDTRKTVPGLRTAQKYAVRCGGAQNHRMGLFDQVLIKENHIAAAGSLTGAIEAARRHAAGVAIEVEVETVSELQEALNARPDIILLDEFSLEDMRNCRDRRRLHLGRRPHQTRTGDRPVDATRIRSWLKRAARATRAAAHSHRGRSLRSRFSSGRVAAIPCAMPSRMRTRRAPSRVSRR